MRDMRVHAILRDINPNLNVQARLEFEQAYYDVAVLL